MRFHDDRACNSSLLCACQLGFTKSKPCENFVYRFQDPIREILSSRKYTYCYQQGYQKNVSFSSAPEAHPTWCSTRKCTCHLVLWSQLYTFFIECPIELFWNTYLSGLYLHKYYLTPEKILPKSLYGTLENMLNYILKILCILFKVLQIILAYIIGKQGWHHWLLDITVKHVVKHCLASSMNLIIVWLMRIC